MNHYDFILTLVNILMIFIKENINHADISKGLRKYIDCPYFRGNLCCTTVHHVEVTLLNKPITIITNNLIEPFNIMTMVIKRAATAALLVFIINIVLIF